MAEPGKAVFLSYAREDADAARRIADALRAFGVEVWFDQNELRGGDAWDAKIKTQIRECTLFVPVISATTENRSEGYFRREWKQGAERTHDMGANRAFLLPVVLDETLEAGADVPDEFMRVQWTRLPNGVPTPEFVGQVKRLLEDPRRLAVAGRGRPTPPEMQTQPGGGVPGGGMVETRRPRGVSAAGSSLPSVGQAKQGDPALQHRRRFGAWAAVLAAIAMIAVTSYFALRGSDRRPGPPVASPSASTASTAAPAATSAATPAVDDKSIAVLPFANFSTDKSNEFFADGLHDEVITALAKIHDLKVISRTSVMAYKNPEERNLRKIAADLGVAHILEGSVQRAGNQVHLNVQLIDARTDEHVWADSYTRDVTDIFSAETDLAVAVTTALKSTLSPDEKSLIDRQPTTSRAAYDLYLRARVLDEQLSYASSRDDCERVVELYRRATDLDHSFLLAHVQAALLQGAMYFLSNIDPTPARRQAAEREVEAAEQLAPDAPETHLARGAFDYTCNFDWSAALAAYEKAQAGLPNNAQLVYRIGLAERRLGRMHNALAQFQRAADLDPNDADTVLTLMEMAFALRRYADVVRMCDHYGPRLSNPDPATEYRIRASYELDHDRAKYLRDYAVLRPPSSDHDGAQAAYDQAMRVGDFRAAQRALANPALTSVNEAGGLFNAPVALHRTLVAWLLGDSASTRRLAAEAIAALRETTPTVRQRQWVAMDIALAEALAGQTDTAIREAKAALERATAADKYSAADYQFSYGQVLVVAGRNAEALKVLRGLMNEPIGEGPNEMRYEPVWSRLKDDPRFDEILNTAKPL
ncbi:MAG TPA: TIR domain-containing protein [Opitutaceae bacterium]|nr:TIR domain-containing protein [Opitutaceae bacterium]